MIDSSRDRKENKQKMYSKVCPVKRIKNKWNFSEEGWEKDPEKEIRRNKWNLGVIGKLSPRHRLHHRYHLLHSSH